MKNTEKKEKNEENKENVKDFIMKEIDVKKKNKIDSSEYRFGLVCLFYENGMHKGFAGITAARKQSALTQKEVVKKSALFNLEYSIKCIEWCIEHKTNMYRLSSELIPFYDFWDGWRDDRDIKNAFKKIVAAIKDKNIRLTVHPGQFTILNSNQPDEAKRKNIIEKSWRELEYHNIMSELCDGAITEITLHTGSKTGDFKERFIQSVQEYRGKIEKIKSEKERKEKKNLLKRMVIENCHNVGIADVIEICRKCNFRPILDVHHDRVCPSFTETENSSKEDNNKKTVSSAEITNEIKKTRIKCKDLVPEILKLWEDFYKIENEQQTNKIKVFKNPVAHISSGKTRIDDPSHSDYIKKTDLDEFKWLWELGFDVEIEAKCKEKAVLQAQNYIRYNKYSEEDK